jgi:hypothetical protein
MVPPEIIRFADPIFTFLMMYGLTCYSAMIDETGTEAATGAVRDLLDTAVGDHLGATAR